jgi:hypothetical protein
MSYLDKKFIPFFESYILAQRGFKKPCLAYYDSNENLILGYKEDFDPLIDDISCLAPLRQQVIEFYTENGISVDISESFFYISVAKTSYKSEVYNNFVDCEWNCCLKLIRDFSDYLDFGDWSIKLTPEQRASIERGLKDVAEGRVIPHEEVMKKVQELLESKKLPVVESMEKTCNICPTQWQGKLEDGRMFYIRYRWGNFNAYLSKEVTNEVVDAIAGEILVSLDNWGDHFDGEMEDEVMYEIMKSKLNFNKVR